MYSVIRSIVRVVRLEVKTEKKLLMKFENNFKLLKDNLR